MSFCNITIPSQFSLIPVDTRTDNLKVLLLPTVSTNLGLYLTFKDYYGTASNSTFNISTTGMDLIDDINNRYTFSNRAGSISFLSDGILSWRTIGFYNGALSPAPFVFNFTTFSAGDFNIAGNTTFVGGEARITSNTTSVAGSLYYNQKVNIQSFITNFIIRFEQTNADGGVFLIQNSSSNALGGTGGAIGYSNIGTSVAIRFDTFDGAGIFSTDVLTNGNIPSGLGASGVLNSTLGLTAGGTFNFNVAVTYNGTILSYTITNIANGSNFTSNATVNIPTVVGANTAWVGFTGATGGATELQFINSWNFKN
jgi:hypothetical protein